MHQGNRRMVKRVSITTLLETALDANTYELRRRFDYYLRDKIPYELQRAIIDVQVTGVQITNNPMED